MSIRRPLASLAKIHPEHIASVARDANQRGRFFMAFDGTIERSDSYRVQPSTERSIVPSNAMKKRPHRLASIATFAMCSGWILASEASGRRIDI